MTLLYLARHGETIDNAREIMQGQTPGNLNEKGIRQAFRLKEEMAGTRIDAFVSSDLRRAVHTCQIVMKAHRQQEIDRTPLLRERDWGDFTGRIISELQNEPWPENVESLEDILQRAEQFIQYIRNTYPGKTVFAVGHGIINKAIQSVLYKRPMKDIEKMANAEVRILKI